MGRRSNRRAPQPPISRIKTIPMHWLSAATNGQLISVPNKPNLYFMPMKTPLSVQMCQTLSISPSWTAQDAILKAKSLLKQENMKFHAINVSATNEVALPQEWEALHTTYNRIQINKDFSSSSIDQFCDSVNNALDGAGEQTLVCLVYSGCGLNRVGFSIAAYLTKYGQMSLQEALKSCDTSVAKIIFKQKPLDVLCEVFSHDNISHGSPPEWLNSDEKISPIGDVPLPLEKYNAMKKLSKKPVTGDERDKVLALLTQAAAGEWNMSKANVPSFTYTQWKDIHMNEIHATTHLCTFVPRGNNAFIVVSEENVVYYVDLAANVWALKIRATCETPAVASCIIIEEKKRAVFLTTDILLLGKMKLNEHFLEERLSYLAYEFTDKLTPEDKKEVYAMQFVFRPMAKISNAGKLKKDLSTLFCKCDGIAFYETSDSPGKAIFLPITPSVILQFCYNGNEKAILYAIQGETNVPIAIYKLPSQKMTGLDGRTNRFEYKLSSNEWNPVAIGHNEQPSTVEEMQYMIDSLTTKLPYDEIFQEFEKKK